jgi:hypothetical protein
MTRAVASEAEDAVAADDLLSLQWTAGERRRSAPPPQPIQIEEEGGKGKDTLTN